VWCRCFTAGSRDTAAGSCGRGTCGLIGQRPHRLTGSDRYLMDNANCSADIRRYTAVIGRVSGLELSAFLCVCYRVRRVDSFSIPTSLFKRIAAAAAAAATDCRPQLAASGELV